MEIGLTLNYWHLCLPEGSLWSPDPTLPLLLGGWKDWEINTSEKHQPMMTESWGAIHTSWCLRGVTLKCIFCPGPRQARGAKPQVPTVVTHLLTSFVLVSFPSLSHFSFPHSCVLGSPPSKSFSLESFLPEEPKWRRSPKSLARSTRRCGFCFLGHTIHVDPSTKWFGMKKRLRTQEEMFPPMHESWMAWVIESYLWSDLTWKANEIPKGRAPLKDISTYPLREAYKF